MRIRLIRKLAEQLDGIDLSDYRIGDILSISQREMELLIAEGWAEPLRRKGDEVLTNPSESVVVAETTTQQTVDGLRRAEQQIEQERFRDDRRKQRTEDHIREDLRDARARTISPNKP